jgi:hypothetical protein
MWFVFLQLEMADDAKEKYLGLKGLFGHSFQVWCRLLFFNCLSYM